MNDNLLLALLLVWLCVLSQSSAIKNGRPVKGEGGGLVNILKGNTRVCRGVVVDQKWVLTAGKCIDERYLNAYRLSIRTKDDKNIDQRVLYTERPENSADIVLIRTTNELNAEHIQKIVLGNSASDKDYIKCKVLGYSDVAKKPVKSFVKESARCGNARNKNILCFDAIKKASICSEDTGAPVLCRTSKKRLLAGLAVVKDGCSTNTISGIRISFHQKWIRQVINAVDCGNPHIIDKGTIRLDINGKTTFGARATVNCTEGYKPSAETVSCGRNGTWSFASCDVQVLRNCKDVLDTGDTSSGFKTIFPDGINNVSALCVMDAEGGGWTVIQKRESASDFYKGWAEYRDGFGDDINFWIGLENIYRLTSQGNYELRIDMKKINNETFIVKYQNFAVGNETDKYKLFIGNYSYVPTFVYQPDPKDGLAYHNDMYFSTYDRDNDGGKDSHCASQELSKGGFWYNYCYNANLNGVYGIAGFSSIKWMASEAAYNNDAGSLNSNVYLQFKGIVYPSHEVNTFWPKNLQSIRKKYHKLYTYILASLHTL